MERTPVCLLRDTTKHTHTHTKLVGCRDRDRMVVRFGTTCAISANTRYAFSIIKK